MKKFGLISSILLGFMICKPVFAINEEITCPDGTEENSHCWKCSANCLATLTGTTMNITGTGKVDTTGSSKVNDIWLTTASWKNYTINTVNIGKDITELGNELFDGIEIQRVNFEEGSKLKTIGHSVFPRAHNENLILPDGVISIGRWSFMRVSNIYCTAEQINGVLKNPQAIDISGNIKQYERNGDKIIVMDGNEALIYSSDFTKKYDSDGNIITKYDFDGNQIGSYRYDIGGNLIKAVENGVEVYRRRIYTPAEATSAVKNNKNKFSIIYR